MIMKRIFLILLLVFLSAGLIFEISGCGRAGGVDKTTQEKGLYYCPMHPTYTSDKPGDCPICNMKLVKKETPVKDICLEHNCTMKDCNMRVKTTLKSGEKVSCPICGEFITTANGKLVEASKHNMGSAVTISPEKQQLIGIKTEPVKRINLTKTIIASGKIAYDPGLVIAQQEFIQAIDNKDSLSQSLIDASRNKLRLLGMSDDEIAGLEKTKKPQTNLYLPGKGENVWAYIFIYEYEIGLVKTGASVEIESVAYPGETFQGEVVSINPVLDPAARTNQVRAEVLNPMDKLKPEMFVSAKINVVLGEKLALPELAVMDTGLRKIVYISKGGGLLEAREVKLGQKAGDYYEIFSGLSEGDIVVTSGNFFIDAESRLKSALEGAGHEHGQ